MSFQSFVREHEQSTQFEGTIVRMTGLPIIADAIEEMGKETNPWKQPLHVAGTVIAWGFNQAFPQTLRLSSELSDGTSDDMSFDQRVGHMRKNLFEKYLSVDVLLGSFAADILSIGLTLFVAQHAPANGLESIAQVAIGTKVLSNAFADVGLSMLRNRTASRRGR